MILVTGGTGTVGREVVERLPAELPVRVMARDPAAVTGAGPRAEAVAGDFEDPPSLARALESVHTAFLVTAKIAGDHDAVFVRAAQMAGVQRVVKLSAAAVLDEGADDIITRWQRTSENVLCASGLEWTLLRPRAFMSNCLSWAAAVRSERTVRALYGRSGNACVDPRDIAEVAVRVLTEEGHAGQAYTLTGPETLTAVGQTELLGGLLGVPLRFEELALHEARQALERRYPAPVAEALLQSAERQRAGAKTEVSDTVGRLTGRPAGTFRAWAEDHLPVFAPTGGTAHI